MKKITEHRYMFPEELRLLCIKNDWMNQSTNAQYEKFLRMSRPKHRMDTDALYRIAQSVVEHTDFEDDLDPDFEEALEENELLEHILFELSSICHTVFSVEDVEEVSQ